ncbi:hypothetical protein FRB94_000618 [Tulasnella sp. JGI-2019a]|nr:hypothetical protein FRB94_000618 [Tulasnella sp. JGI-2019a]KAG9002330.1 hypothetical protein FRB93_011756 [Tulasnella sp. JGI-2019a]KAG9024414.1 hypothetical protein FRB95_011541 [Tulasnella sp. JGI-2019a]
MSGYHKPAPASHEKALRLIYGISRSPPTLPRTTNQGACLMFAKIDACAQSLRPTEFLGLGTNKGTHYVSNLRYVRKLCTPHLFAALPSFFVRSAASSLGDF